jgi:hypothetical protein
VWNGKLYPQNMPTSYRSATQAKPRQAMAAAIAETQIQASGGDSSAAQQDVASAAAFAAGLVGMAPVRLVQADVAQSAHKVQGSRAV